MYWYCNARAGRWEEFGIWIKLCIFSFSGVNNVAVSSWVNTKDEDFLLLKCSEETMDESNLMGFFQCFLIFASLGNNLEGEKICHNTVLVLDRLQFRLINNRKLFLGVNGQK